MSRTLAAALRRANRFMRSSKVTKATLSAQKVMSDLMVKSAFAALKPKISKATKPAVPKAGQSLGVVLKQLRAAQVLLPAARAGSDAREISPRIPSGALYLSRTHRSAAGSRGYKLYLPASQPRPKGLILMLHGCNQTPDDFAVGTHMNAMAEKHGLAIAYPAQTPRANAACCWNWFKPVNQVRGSGEPEILASLARKLMREFSLDRTCVFVAGLSAGGAMAAIMIDVYPDVFSAAGIHSGLARGAARDMLSAISAMRTGRTSWGGAFVASSGSDPVRRIIFQGDADTTVHPSNAALIVAAAIGDGALPTKVSKRSVRGRGYARSDFAGADGEVLLELWTLEGAGHAWSGGRVRGSYTDRNGPDASAQMTRFFLAKQASDRNTG
jgi:poly(hydroxyalkanoate) depolymerase family esterase